MHCHNEFIEAIKALVFVITLPITCIIQMFSGFVVVGILIILVGISLLTGSPIMD